jgi:hypothetical protein
MTIDAPGKIQKEYVEPISPLAYKTEENNPFGQHIQPPKQAAAPIRYNLLQITNCPGFSKLQQTKPVFVPFHNPTRKLARYIRTPLNKNALGTGCVYIFQVDDHALNKVGYVSQRGKNSSIEVLYNSRMKEHKRCGWEPKVVFKYEVAHAERVEKIIHHHLEKHRRKETNLCNRQCNHRTHQEWFDIPLQEVGAITKAWIRWMETDPYVEQNGRFVLRPEWQEKLNNIRLDLESDYWLHWLSHNLPKEQDHTDDLNKTGASLIATNSSIIEGIPFRLKHSKTWPRRIYPASTDKY